MLKKFFCLIVLILIISIGDIIAQSYDTSGIPVKYGSTHYGTDFWMTFHPNYQTVGSANSIRIYITSSVETSVKIEIPGKGYLTQLNTIPNNTVQVDIPIAIGQPIVGGINIPPPVEQVYDGVGIHVTSLDPVVVYGLARGSGSSDGYMALPVSTWGKEYIIASWADVSDNETEYLPSYASVIAAFDNTRVSFKLGGNSGTKTMGGMSPGETRQFTLYSGDVLVIASSGRNSDLSGSLITANKPIGVITGNRCATISETETGCDYLAEMELPTQVWGKEFHVGPINKRKRNPIIKIIPKEEGTKIYKSGIEIASLKYAGGLEGDGWLRVRSDYGSPKAVTISTSKPASITLFNSSRTEDTVSIDPFQMLIIPVEQYQKEIFFTTPSAKNYIEFSTNYINIIYESDETGSVPDDLELAQELYGTFQWTKINITSAAPGMPFGVSSNGRRYFLKQFQLPSYGSYKVRANNPIMVYAYGYSSNASYGYPAGSVLVDLEKNLDNLSPVPTYTVECDGTVNNALVEDMPKSNDRSYLSVVSLQNHESYNYDFTFSAFMPGEKDKTNWNLLVKDKSKDAKAVITFGDRTGNDTTIVISYFIRKPDINPKAADLGLLKISEKRTSDYWLVNRSSTSPLILNNVFLKYDDRGFEVLDTGSNVIGFPLIIPPLDSFKIKVRFTGLQKGVYSDSIGISDNCFTWILGTVKAETGVPQINVSDYTFPDTYLQAKASGQITIRNEGNYNLSITNYTPPVDNDLKVEIQNISSANPLVIGPGQIFSFEVTFQPMQEREYLDSVVFVSDATGADPVAVIKGKGVIKVGVDDSDNLINKFFIYPNPAENNLLVSYDNSISAENVRVYDVYGNCAAEKNNDNDGKSLKLDVSGLPNGVYYLILNTNGGTFKSRFIILH